MANFMKFIVLALIGFALGAGLAWFQKDQAMKNNVPEVSAPAEDATEGLELPTVGEGRLVPDAPKMPEIEGSVEGAVEDTMEAAGEMAEEAGAALSDMTEKAADAATEIKEDVAADMPDIAEKTAQKVAGSTVGGAFSLTDHNGKAVTEKSWPGKKKLVFFGFTYCPDVCPAGLDKMTTVLEQLGDSAGQIQPLFVSTDPKRDTPERMKEYLADYDDSFVGLTGTEEQVEQAKSAYKVYAAKAEGGDEENYLMNHSSYIYLMSEDDALLEIFGSSDTVDTIVPKVQQHLTAAE